MSHSAGDPPSGAIPDANGRSHPKAGFWTLSAGSIGVVFGDIGTSPLYAFREAVTAASGHGPVQQHVVLGVLSLILWALIVIVTIKYVLILLRADNNGEGGTLSLTALAFRAIGRRSPFLLALGIVGAAMFYGDSLITPAISVLSAVEGLRLVTPAFQDYVVPLTLVILVVLFAVQRRGTSRVAIFFAPVMGVWFVALAITGALHVTDSPEVLGALNPLHGIRFLTEHGTLGLMTLGLVFLAVTGGEALYADLGHFGRKPIQAAWLLFVLPALVINYFGQGALVLSDPSAIENPFYRLVPSTFVIPMIILATAATVIASQAVITGAYSLTRQAIQLGLFPRLTIQHTSEAHPGQIYLPGVNTFLLIGVVALVLLFGSSSRLASAYGVAVTTTMLVDGLLALVVLWKLWQWRLGAALLVMTPLILVDATFLTSNLMKLVDGAWVPLVFAAVVAATIAVWRRGTRILAEKTRRIEVPMDILLRNLESKPPHAVPGTAIFLTSDPESAPTALLHNLKHNKVLHERNLVLTIVTSDMPRVPKEERIQIIYSSPRFTRMILRFGFMETPNVPQALALARKQGWPFDIMSTSFFLSRRALRPAAKSGIAAWLDRFYIGLARSAADATDFFHIPTGRVVEVGTQVTV